MTKFRKKPVVIEAIQWTGVNTDEVLSFVECSASIRRKAYKRIDNNHEIVIETLEGDMTASKGDWIIRGVKGEVYPCKPDIFEATYESVEDGPQPLCL